MILFAIYNKNRKPKIKTLFDGLKDGKPTYKYETPMFLKKEEAEKYVLMGKSDEEIVVEVNVY